MLLFLLFLLSSSISAGKDELESIYDEIHQLRKDVQELKKTIQCKLIIENAFNFGLPKDTCACGEGQVGWI